MKSPGLVPESKPAVTRSSAGPAPRPRAARLLLPREHGSWALAFEPLVLGLLAAPSLAGAALAFAVSAAFFARTPCKAAIAGRTLPERALAGRILGVLVTLGAAGIGTAAGWRGFSALWPLLPALSCGAIFLFLDLRNDARSGVAEVAGAAAFACVPAALAVLAGWPASRALGLALVMLVRAVPTVLVIRACLRRRKGRPAAPRLALLAAWGGMATLLMLMAYGVAGWLPAGLAGVLALRATWLLGASAPAWNARQLGILEAVLGAVYVITAGMRF